MAGWPTISELADFLQTTIPDGDATATLLLDLAGALFRSAAKQQIDEVVDEAITLDGNGSRILLLPELPVTDVSAVTLDGNALTSDDYEWSAEGLLKRAGDRGSWGTKYRSVEVTYSHGYASDEIPEDIRAAVLSMAARAWTSPVSVRQETLGGYSVTYLADPGGVFLSQAERTIAERYRSEALA